jgi:lipopolysaccharide biosynthesis protein
VELAQVAGVEASVSDVSRSGDLESEIARIGDENARLRQRVTDLELTVLEYRRQMSGVLGSVSWRVTSPLRVLSARYRTGKVRTRRTLKRWRERTVGSAGLRLAGLFGPEASELPSGSPLLRVPNLGVDRGMPNRVIGSDPEVDAPRVLVLAHVHYPELWGDIDERLGRIHEPYDLLVTVTQGTAESIIPTIARRHRTARIEIVPNRGRDWGPAVHVAGKGLLSGYDAVAKVHTKKSEHRIDGDAWRLELLDGVFESPDAIRRVVDLLSLDPSVGVVLPTGHLVGTEHWGSDLGIVEALAARLPMAFDPDRLSFVQGSMFWCRPWLLERLADLNLDWDDFEAEGGQYDGTTAHALERMVGVMCQVAGLDMVEAMDVSRRVRAVGTSTESENRPSVLAFYLPQYHRDAANDEFWGEGFTDWDNVRSASALFAGHRQPVSVPSSVGYYDLSSVAELERQAAQMACAGVDGAVMYYYWFDGKKVLDKPLDLLLASPSVPMQFALCWANEPWTRRWDGLDSDVLIEQKLTGKWEHRFYADIRSALFDPRYITIDGKPLLLVYRLDLIKNVEASVRAWRHLAAEDGLPGLHVLGVLPSRDFGTVPVAHLAELDGLVSFPPGSGVNLVSLMEHLPHGSAGLGGEVFSYDAACDFVSPAGPVGFTGPVHPTVFPGWDNTARRGVDAYLFHGANPLAFRRWLSSAVSYARAQSPSLVFINAWNEWAEGAAIEGTRLPDVFPTYREPPVGPAR